MIATGGPIFIPSVLCPLSSVFLKPDVLSTQSSHIPGLSLPQCFLNSMLSLPGDTDQVSLSLFLFPTLCYLYLCPPLYVTYICVPMLLISLFPISMFSISILLISMLFISMSPSLCNLYLCSLSADHYLHSP